MSRQVKLLPAWTETAPAIWRRVTLTTDRHVSLNRTGRWRWRTTRNMGPDRGEVLASGTARSAQSAMRAADKIGVTL